MHNTFGGRLVGDNNDIVYAPKHYTQGNVECIDAMVAALERKPSNRTVELTLLNTYGGCTTRIV